MALPNEFAFYSSRSGLPSGTLNDHKLAYYAAKGHTVGTLTDREYAYWLAQTALTRSTAEYAEARYAYFDANTVGTGTIADLMVEFFANPPAP